MAVLLIMSISGILNLIMGLIVIFGGREKESGLPFALFSITTFFWAISNLFIHTTDYAVFVRLSYSLGALLPTFLLVWIYRYRTADKQVWKSVLIYSAGAVFTILPFVGGLVVDNIRNVQPEGFISDAGALYPLYVGYYLAAYAIVLLCLIRMYRTSEGEKKNQVRVILTGFSLYGGLGMLFSLVLPMFGYDRLIDLDVPTSVVFVSFTMYAMVHYRWMGIKAVAVELLSLLIVGMTLLDIFMADTLQQRIYKAISFVVVSSLAAMLITSVLNEVRRKEELQLISDKLAQANDKLRKLDNAKTDFISIASHQLKTPLTAVKGYVSLALEGAYGMVEPRLHDVLRKVYDSSDRTVSLVEDLLNMSRIESGRMEFKFDKWKMEDICREVVDTLALKAKEHKLSLEYTKPDAPLPEVTVDGHKVREVISNLVDNAIKYTPEGGVKLKLEQLGDSIRVTVSDTGIGIPQSELPYLFAKFSRGKDTTRLNTGGTGLGLYVGKVMVENNGGRIWADSDGEGKGSRFIVEMPVTQSEELLKTGWGGSNTRSALSSIE